MSRRWRYGLAALAIAIVTTAAVDTMLSSRQVAVNAGVVIPKGDLTEAVRAIENFRTTAPSGWVTVAGAVDEVRTVLAAAISNQALVLLGDPMTGVRFSVTGNYVMASGSTVEVQRARITRSLTNSGSMTADVMRVQWLSGSFGLVTSNLVLEASGSLGDIQADTITINGGMSAFETRGTNLATGTLTTPRIVGIASQEQVRVTHLSQSVKVYSSIVTNIYDRYAVTNELFLDGKETNYSEVAWAPLTNVTLTVTTNIYQDPLGGYTKVTFPVYSNEYTRTGVHLSIADTTATNTYYSTNTVVYPSAGTFTNIFISTNVVKVDQTFETTNFVPWAYVYTNAAYVGSAYTNLVYTNDLTRILTTNTVTYSPPDAVWATGGNVSNYVESTIAYTRHTFSVGSNTFTVSKLIRGVETLLVAGGGSGGAASTGSGGGGGGGGVVARPISSLATGNYPIVVGAGGVGVSYTTGNDGANSTAFGCTAVGGGRGGRIATAGFPGGSGGGGTGADYPGGAGTQTNQAGDSGIYGYGKAGGASVANPGYAPPGGGGGGATVTGGVARLISAGNCRGGNGGNGYTWFGAVYGGGGGGYGDYHQSSGLGGTGGGGTGANSSGGQATSGSPNTGGGGGGRNFVAYATGSGGSGVAIVLYSKNDNPVSSSLLSSVTNTCVVTNTVIYDSPGLVTNVWVFTNNSAYQNFTWDNISTSLTYQAVGSNCVYSLTTNGETWVTSLSSNQVTTLTESIAVVTNVHDISASRYVGRVSTNYVDKTFTSVLTNTSGRVYINEPTPVAPVLGYTNGMWAYFVSTPAHLVWVRSQTNGLASSNIWQTADIDLADSYLWNVGANDVIEGFRGIAGSSRQMTQAQDLSRQRWCYYGGGHKIVNAWGRRPAINIVGTGLPQDYSVGLFADGLLSATVQDLVFSGYLCVDGIVATNSSPGIKYVSGFVGASAPYGSPGVSPRYERLVVNVDVDINVTNGWVRYGGIVGGHVPISTTTPYPLTQTILSDILVGGSVKASSVYFASNSLPDASMLCGGVVSNIYTGVTNSLSRVAGLVSMESTAGVTNDTVLQRVSAVDYRYLIPQTFVGLTFGDTNLVTADPTASFDYAYTPANPLGESKPLDYDCPYQGYTNWTRLGQLCDWYPFPLLNFRTNGAESAQATWSPAFQNYTTVVTNFTVYPESSVAIGGGVYVLVQTNETAITRHDYQHLEFTNAYVVGATMLSTTAVRFAVQNQLYERHDDVETTDYTWIVTTTTNLVASIGYASELRINNPWTVLGDVVVSGNVYAVDMDFGVGQELGLLRLPGALTSTNLGSGFASQVSPAYTSVFINVSSSGVVIASSVASVEFDWRPDNADSTLTVWSSSNGVDYSQSSTNVFLAMTNRYFRFDATNSAGFVAVSTAVRELSDHHEIARGASVFGDLTNGMVAILFAAGGLYESTRPADQFAIYSSAVTSAVARADGAAVIRGTFTSAVTRITVDLYNPDGANLTDNMFMHSLQLLNSTTDLLYAGTPQLDSRDTPETGRYHVDIGLRGYDLVLRAFANYGVETRVLIGGSE